MDPYIHTAIATALVFVAFHIGRYLENRDLTEELGHIHADHLMRLLMRLEAKAIDIDVEEGTMEITFDDGTKEQL
tara:strand:+ start:500 stop:724 length:225 start_codon:yes stop_codon:yes gene_type:complete